MAWRPSQFRNFRQVPVRSVGNRIGEERLADVVSAQFGRRGVQLLGVTQYAHGDLLSVGKNSPADHEGRRGGVLNELDQLGEMMVRG